MRARLRARHANAAIVPDVYCRLLTIYTRHRRLRPMAKPSLRPARRAPQLATAVDNSRPPAAERTVGANHPISLLQANSLPTLVQRELERMILAGDLAAGEQLREVEVAAMLGVSRGPVREAFRALEESGLVRLEKNRGVYVRQISVREADEIYEMRAILDEFVGRKLAETITPLQIRELRQKVAQMEAAASSNDVDAYLAANVDFHDRMVQLTGNDKLLLVYRRLVNELHLFRRMTLEQGGTLPVSTREHREIVKLIADRQPAAAGRALHEHVMASRARMHKTWATREAGADEPDAPAARKRRALR
jgi:phosphonate utilization transcriptional regulator